MCEGGDIANTKESSGFFYSYIYSARTLHVVYYRGNSLNEVLKIAYGTVPEGISDIELIQCPIWPCKGCGIKSVISQLMRFISDNSVLISHTPFPALQSISPLCHSFDQVDRYNYQIRRNWFYIIQDFHFATIWFNRSQPVTRTLFIRLIRVCVRIQEGFVLRKVCILMGS